ncbi:MAG: hypothetical protein ACOZCE_06915 [Spirochaetota bacterium]
MDSVQEKKSILQLSQVEVVKKVWSQCTWGDTKETPEHWLQIITGTDEAQKIRLLNKLFLEYVDYLSIRSLFDDQTIKTYLLSLNKPMNRRHLEKRRKVWRFLFCGIKEPIPELDWVEIKKS